MAEIIEKLKKLELDQAEIRNKFNNGKMGIVGQRGMSGKLSLVTCLFMV